MSALPKFIKSASQTPIYKSEVCHTCQRVTVCINSDNACQQSNRCGCTVGKVISVHGCSLTAWRQASYSNIQSGPVGHLCNLWSLISSSSAPSHTLQWLQYFSTLSFNQHDFPKKRLFCHKMCVLIFSMIFLWNIFIIRKVERKLIKNIHKSSCQRAVILVRFTRNQNSPDRC